jgi:hypothetical protein
MPAAWFDALSKDVPSYWLVLGLNTSTWGWESSDVWSFTPTAAGPGVLYFSEDGQANGLWSLDTVNGASTNVGVSGVTGSTVGLTYEPVGDILLGSQPFGLLHIERDGSGSTVHGTLGIEGMAYDPAGNVLYGAINSRFFTVDPNAGLEITSLPSPGFDAEGLAWNPTTGHVYAVGDHTNLAKYDSVANTWQTVGSTGINWDQGGLAYDPGRNVLYACGEGAGSVLYEIDPATAVPTAIGDAGVTLQGGLAFAPGVVPFASANAAAPIVVPATGPTTD